MPGLLPPLLLLLVAVFAFIQALRKNRAGLAGDGVICALFGWFLWLLAAAYIAGYGVALWLS